MFFKLCRRHRAILLVFVVALSGRLLIAAIHAQNFPTYFDENAYLELAESIQHNFTYTRPDGSEELTRGPLYSGFLAVSGIIFGLNPVAISIVQCFIGAALWALVFHTTRCILQDSNVPKFAVNAGCCSIVLASLMPVTLFRDPLILSEGIASVLLTLTALLWGQSLQTASGPKRRYCMIASGICCGLHALAKPAFVPLLLVVPLLQLCCSTLGRRPVWLSGAFLFSISGALVIAPWTLRNYTLTDGFIPVGVGGGPCVWIGSYNDGTIHDSKLRESINSINDGQFSPRSRFLSDQAYKSRGIDRIVRAPMNYFTICLARFPRMWLTSHFDPLRRELGSIHSSVRIPFYCLNLCFLALALIGGILGIRRLATIPSVAFIIWLYAAGSHSLIFSGSRHGVPIWPLIAVCTAYGTARCAVYVSSFQHIEVEPRINERCNSI